MEDRQQKGNGVFLSLSLILSFLLTFIFLIPPRCGVLMMNQPLVFCPLLRFETLVSISFYFFYPFPFLLPIFHIILYMCFVVWRGFEWDTASIFLFHFWIKCYITLKNISNPMVQNPCSNLFLFSCLFVLPEKQTNKQTSLFYYIRILKIKSIN